MKEKTRKSKTAVNLIRAVLLFIIIFCIGYIANFYIESKNVSDKVNTLSEGKVSIYKSETALSSGEAQSETSGEPGESFRLDVDFAALQSENPDIKAWIYIPAAGISYPVLYSGDDSFYLSHLPDKTESAYGSIFIEAACAPDFSDLHTIVYGHDMIDKSMFAGIKKYEDESFYFENPDEIYIGLPGETRIYKIFSVQTADPLDKSIYTVGFSAGGEYDSFVNTLKSNSAYETGETPEKGAQIITLSTCRGSSMRFTVHAYRIA